MMTMSVRNEPFETPDENAVPAAKVTASIAPISGPSKDELRIDRLSYLADMIRELQVLASESHCETLSGILGLAHAEVRQQMTAAQR